MSESRANWTLAENRDQSFDSVIAGRRSVRAFLPQPIPKQVITDAIEAAGWAPSPHGRQPWRFVVLESVDHRKQLADAMADTWREQLELDGQTKQIIETRLTKGRKRLLDAPFVVVVCLYMDDLDVYPDDERNQAERLMAIQSLGSAVQNFLLSIWASGYDAGWMCAPLFCPDVVREALEIEHSLEPHALLPIGVAARDPVRKPRRSIDELIVMWR